LSLGLRVAGAYRWRLIGTLVLLFVITLVAGIVIDTVMLSLGMGAVAFDWGVMGSNPSPAALAGALTALAAQSSLFLGAYGVMIAALYAFALTVFLIFYRGAAQRPSLASAESGAPAFPASQE